KDTKKCMAPLCGGYYVLDVNRKTPERYVSGLTLPTATFDAATAQLVTDAPPEELVLRGKLSAKDPKFGTQSFIVSSAYRGMPGKTAPVGSVFYSAKPRSPKISCKSAPCSNEVATKLNSTAVTYFMEYAVAEAAAVFVDQAWLADRVRNHGAVVAGAIVDGKAYPLGAAPTLSAKQVYLNVKDMAGPCPVYKLAACPAGTGRAYSRSQDLCTVPGECVAAKSCPSKVPAQCAAGYQVAAWNPTGGSNCLSFACDPEFVWP
ncbi:MAG: hypothetical protein HY902_04990, partial [Deltaproteobacteria bacterium]|nr:hypothetical protein [Deltaproteobacteria bacterium]